MNEYPKIRSVFKRDLDTHKFIMGSWSLPEFEYLADNEWIWTEKVDGTNIRVKWFVDDMGMTVYFAGKTDRADIPKPLRAKLLEMFPYEKLMQVFPSTSICLYGEGYGAGIQKGGKYIPDGVSFILFDVKIGDWWLKRGDVIDIGKQLDIDVVPLVYVGTIHAAINLVMRGIESRFNTLVQSYGSGENTVSSLLYRPFLAEGLVGIPSAELHMRDGHRIITKIKTSDFDLG